MNIKNNFFLNIETNILDNQNIFFCIIVSEWNIKITKKLLDGIVKTLLILGIKNNHIKIFKVPGSFEIIYTASRLSKSKKFDVILCVGSILQGETQHFHYLSSAVINGIKDINLISEIPVVLCLLTDNHIQQSFDRSGGKYGNKGIDAAKTAIRMVYLNKQIKNIN